MGHKFTTKEGVVSALAKCDDCGFIAEDHRTAKTLARRHTIDTGHTVQVEEAVAITFRKSPS
jgi:hypothetical protein